MEQDDPEVYARIRKGGKKVRVLILLGVLISLLALSYAFSRPVYVVLSVHTELFNETKLQAFGWDIVPSNDTCNNINNIPQTFLPILDKYNVPATWFMEEDWWYGETWSSATSCSKQAVDKLAENGEIGLHVHFAKSAEENLSSEKVFEMISKGYYRLSDAGFQPKSFVSGNYVLNEAVVEALERLNISTDISMNRDQSFFRNAPANQYHPSKSNLLITGNSTVLLLPNDIDIGNDKIEFKDMLKRLVFVWRIEKHRLTGYGKPPILILAVHSWNGLNRGDMENLDWVVGYLKNRNAVFVTATEANKIYHQGQ